MIIEDNRTNKTLVGHPNTIEDAWNMKVSQTNACFASGGTLLQVNWEAGNRLPGKIISLESIKKMNGITEETVGLKRVIRIGALTKLSECIRDPLIMTHLEVLRESCRKIASPGVRNRASIGGNISSGIGDAIPALLALNAEITLYNGEKYVVEPIANWVEFAQGNQELPFLIVDIRIPFSVDTDRCSSFYHKVGRREAFSISLITVSGYVKVNELGLIHEIRLGVGGGNNPPKRLYATEELLINKTPNNKLWMEAHEAVIKEVKSYSDPFATSDYRKTVAANLIIASLSDYYSDLEG